MASVQTKLQVLWARRADGLLQAVRLYAPHCVDVWFWLNREAGTAEELKPHRVECAA